MNVLVNFTYYSIQANLYVGNVKETTRVFEVTLKSLNKKAIQEIYEKMMAITGSSFENINIRGVWKLDDDEPTTQLLKESV